MDGSVKIIEKVTVILKNLVLIIVLCQLVVDVVKLNLLGEKVIVHHTDAVPAHLLIGNRLLGGFGDAPVPLGFFDSGAQPPFL